MKLTDIPPGSELAYRCAAKQIVEQVEFELETCQLLWHRAGQVASSASAVTRVLRQQGNQF